MSIIKSVRKGIGFVIVFLRERGILWILSIRFLS